ncbi:hypothetical protein ACN47E_003476 [Coniothyrium glycines]
MRVTTLLPALLSVTVFGKSNDRPAANDGRGATIYSMTYYRGSSAAIPANAWCNNLDNIFGKFDGTTRSITVEKGFKCSFHLERDCPSNGARLDLGSKDVGQGLGKLSQAYDKKIRSVHCARI